MAIGDNVKKIRTERKLTQEKLAKEMGISRSYLSDIENNRKNPSLRTLESIADKLNVTTTYLATGKKMLADLTDEEKKEGMVAEIDGFEQKVIKKRQQLKNTLTELKNIELDYVEIEFINESLEFLANSHVENLILFTSILKSINKARLLKEDDSINKEDMNYFFNLELEEVIKHFEKFYFEEIEGD